MIQDSISLSDLQYKVDEYVRESLDNFSLIKIDRPKVIHDSVHGTNMFHPYEIAFLDLPLVQRLRRISQTDVATLVFPAGNHNRFEHTLGVTVIAGQMVDALYKKDATIGGTNTEKLEIYQNCRVAAILHDCGHGPFSHLSEQIYKHQFKKIKENNEKLNGASAHEVLSFCIATSKPLKKFYNERIKPLYPEVNIDLDFVGEMIVGYVDRVNSCNKAFAVEIINSAFDADKLDYVLRDAHATGVKMVIDLPRLMYTLDVQRDDKDILRLSVDISGTTALEEIVFNKMLLTSTIYHHQKVRAAGCVLQRALKRCSDFVFASDLLKHTDDSIYSLTPEFDQDAKEDIIDLKNRVLPKRAFCISTRTLEKRTDIYKITPYIIDSNTREDIIGLICEQAQKNGNLTIKPDDIWFDCPETPKFQEAQRCIIKSKGAPGGYVTLSKVFPTEDWVRAYSENKWQSFVFARSEHRDSVYEACRQVFESLYNVKFNHYSKELCKLSGNS